MPIAINGSGTITGVTDFANSSVGKILQVVSSVKLGSQVVNSQSQTDITDLSVNITPASNSSKIAVFYHIATGCPANNTYAIYLVRGSTNLFLGNGEAGSYPATQATTFGSIGLSNGTIQSLDGAYVDDDHSSGGTQLTYKIQGRVLATNNVFRVGRSWDVDNISYRSMASSSIVVMEVGG